jgi:chorismate mutase
MGRNGAGDEQVSDRLWAVRGAVSVGRNDRGAILSAAEELMRALMERNELAPERMVSCVFTCTGDLNSEFPAVAARKVGLDTVPLLCAQEMDVPGAMRGVIRVLVHYYAPADHAPTHAYLGKTQDLRADLHSAQ